MPELSRKYSDIFKLLHQQSVPFPQDNNIHTLVAVPHQASNTSQIIMNNLEGSNSNADAVSLIEQVRAATQSNPSFAGELSTFLLDTAPDSQPVTKEQHPLFFDATKTNPGKLFVLIPNRTWCSERSRANVKFIQHQSTTRTNHHHRRRHHHQSKL